MQRIGFVIQEGFQMIGLAAQAVFEYSNRVAGKSVYEVRVLSEKGGPVRSSLGIALQTERFSGRAFDTLIIIGTEDASPDTDARAAEFHSTWIKAIEARDIHLHRRVHPGRSGLAATVAAPPRIGIYARELQRRFPDVKVEEDRIFIIDGPIWTSAGATAGLDLALAMVEKDLGAEAARSVAKKLVMHHRRAGGQSQHSELLALSPKSDRIQNALSYAEKNLGSSLSVDKLAEVASLEPASIQSGLSSGNGTISGQGRREAAS